ncbi:MULTISPECIES: FAD-dependent monooxygenase [unclassified Streptomyces]|uniref:FAD-dependent monooxygenase n=1 Tax=unclassified Streptomyces TaxID=2593676 RepID=UPI0016617ED6|nr:MULTISPECIES: FAD-dependent monooxygenase [unclassified Streptomyces]MBD0707906.1 monooxygenase [Streptomyces sp. CBMA291]MBD0717607.1 monooxygenase [Streptomyces sp. CBMA370]
MDAQIDADVIVIGAGPTGLMLAGELRLGGVGVVVAEALERPTGQSRGLGFTARALESFDQRGLVPRFGGLETSPMGHFGGVVFDYTVLEDAHFGARGIPQSTTEAVLEEWAGELGADIRRGLEFHALEQDDDGVVAILTDPDGVRHRLRGRYLVGADGGRSAVREAGGFDFPGISATRGMYLADVVGCAVEPRPLGERLPGGMVMAAPLAEGVDRVIVCEDGTPPADRSENPEFAEVAAAWQRLTGEDISGGGAAWVSSFTDATRQATAYRRGRVLLAGDAAHVHLPAGGQGLSTGVQDAVNLGWKLAATIRGHAPEGLLDTYHEERHAVGGRLLSNTRAQGTVFLGGPESQPFRDLFAELIEYDEVKRHLAGSVSHLDVRYGPGAGAAGPWLTEHRLTGRRLPPRELETPAGPVRTPELLHSAQGLLLDLTGDAVLRATADRWKDRVDTVTGIPREANAFGGAAALLVRPDGYVAWAGADTPGLTTALRRWFGAPGSPDLT